MLKLLPPDTRIELKNISSLRELIVGNPSEIKKVLGISKQQLSKYKTGKTRLTIGQLDILSKSFGFEWRNNISSFGLEASAHKIKLPENIEISENIAWLLGFHATESSETPKSFGICNSEPVLIERSKKALTELNIPEKMMKIEVRYIKNGEKQKILKEFSKYFRSLDVRFRKLNKNSLTKKPLFTLRISSRLIKNFFEKMEAHFISNCIKYSNKILAAFLQGIYDADGWFNKAKNIIVLSQRERNLIDFVCKSLQNLNIKIRREYWKYRNYHVCVIIYGKKGENIKKFLNTIGFSHPVKATRVKDFLLPAQVDPKANPNWSLPNGKQVNIPALKEYMRRR